MLYLCIVQHKIPLKSFKMQSFGCSYQKQKKAAINYSTSSLYINTHTIKQLTLDIIL